MRVFFDRENVRVLVRFNREEEVFVFVSLISGGWLAVFWGGDGLGRLAGVEVVPDVGAGTGVAMPEGMAERGCVGVTVPVPGVGVGIWEVDREEVAVDDGLLLFSLRPVRRRKRSFSAILSEYDMPPRIGNFR